MSDPQQNRPGRIRLRDNDEHLHEPSSSASAQLGSSDLSDETAAKVGGFARFCATPALRQLRHLELLDFAAQNLDPIADAQHSAFSTLARLESLRLKAAMGVDRLLPQLARAPALRTLTIVCTPDNPLTLRLYGPAHPSQEALRRLLAAAPLLAVRLELAASIDEWRSSTSHRRGSAADRQQIDEQWRQLQRMGADLERVTIADQ